MTESIDRVLGRIEEKLDRVQKDIELLNVKRDEIFNRVRAVEKTKDEIKKSLEHIEARLVSIETPVAHIKKWHERAIGVSIFISVIAALLGGTMASYWHKIIAVFKGL